MTTALRAGTDTGSLVNSIYSSFTPPEPQVGMGATILHWTDRTAGTIIKAEPGVFIVQCDKATRTDSWGMSDCQDYSYEPDPNGSIYIFRKVARGKAKGAWRENGRKEGNGVLIGKRDHHFDFSF